MADPTKPAKSSLGLEVWANGTWDEIEALRAQLGTLGLMAAPAAPAAMGGADRGRYRRYGRLHVRGDR